MPRLFSCSPLIGISIGLPYLQPDPATIASLLGTGILAALITGPLASLHSELRIGALATASILRAPIFQRITRSIDPTNSKDVELAGTVLFDVAGLFTPEELVSLSEQSVWAGIDALTHEALSQHRMIKQAQI